MEHESGKSKKFCDFDFSSIACVIVLYDLSKLLDTNSKLQHKVYDLESVIRVHENINRTGKNGG